MLLSRAVHNVIVWCYLRSQNVVRFVLVSQCEWDRSCQSSSESSAGFSSWIFSAEKSVSDCLVFVGRGTAPVARIIALFIPLHHGRVVVPDLRRKNQDIAVNINEQHSVLTTVPAIIIGNPGLGPIVSKQDRILSID